MAVGMSSEVSSTPLYRQLASEPTYGGPLATDDRASKRGT
jgi:hypothetical protein